MLELDAQLMVELMLDRKIDQGGWDEDIDLTELEFEQPKPEVESRP